jgi:hypothetical protein
LHDRITPLLLTLDEMPNLERTFASLAWANRIVVVDSGSRDGTREWLGRDSRVSLFERPFDSFAAQANFGVRETGIDTEWVLSLDADHVLSEELVAELATLDPDERTGAYSAKFVYVIHGRRLHGSLYPPRVVLARREKARFLQDGHAHRLVVEGRTERLRGSILHDDRKPRSRWLAEQVRYAAAEAGKLLGSPRSELSLQDRLRRVGFVAPWLVPLYCLTVKRGLFSGRAGWIYAGERAIAEWLLTVALFSRSRNADVE